MTVSNAHIYKLTERHELRKFGINAVEVPCADKVILNLITRNIHIYICSGPRSAVGNMSGYRCESDCKSRGREFDPGPVPNFRGD